MKGPVEIMTLLIISSCTLTSQKVLFRPELKPSSVYETTVENSTTSEVTYIGSEEFMARIKEKGVTSPTISSTKLLMKSRMQTYELQKNNRFRMRTEFIEINTSGKESLASLLKEIKIYSTGNKDMNIVVDSIIGITDQDLKASFSNNLEQLAAQNIYPDRKIKLGESFEKTTPFTFTMAEGKNISVEIVSTYRLDTIEKEFAVFDIAQKIKMDLSIITDDINVHGIGQGRIVYDLVNKTNQLNETEFEFECEWSVEDITIISKSITSSKTETIVK